MKQTGLKFGLAILGVAPFALLISSIQRDVWWQETKSGDIVSQSTPTFLNENDITVLVIKTDFTTKLNPFRYNNQKRNINLKFPELQGIRVMLKDGGEVENYGDFMEENLSGSYEDLFEEYYPDFVDEGDTINSDENDFCSAEKEKFFGDGCCKHFRTITNIMIAAVVFAFCAWILLLWFLTQKGASSFLKWASVSFYIICGILLISAVVLWNEKIQDLKCGDILSFASSNFVKNAGGTKQTSDSTFLVDAKQTSDSTFLVGFYLACVGGGLSVVCALCAAMAHRFMDFQQPTFAAVSEKVTVSVKGLVF